MTGTGFFADAWRSACRPPVYRRCTTLAVVVGTLLTVVNQGDVIWVGAIDTRLVLKVAANFVIPFVVSNLGAMATLPPREGA